MFEKQWFMYSSDDGDVGGQGHVHDENCDHDHDHEEDSQIIVMVDSETGEEYAFEVVDHFDFEGETYTVLITADEDEDGEAEWIIAKVISEDDGTLGLESLGDADGDRVYEEYERLLAEEYDEEDEEDED
ncbi:MAG TPA: DUF1292 domain-containing protein [Clostridiaceae bacterium]|jgi:uncharacterized protein YrzB (UPF0473 family)|nr:DUF1292 domain-containing protein [Clostridiaceae bacterium]